MTSFIFACMDNTQALCVARFVDYYSIPQTGNASPSIRLTFPAFFLTFLSHHSMPRVSRNMPMRMVVPCSACDSAVMVWFRFRQIRRQRYSPMPLAFLSVLPLQPVKPFSKIRGRSSAAMPIPVSRMHSVFGYSRKIETVPPEGVYFNELESTCSSTNSSHFSSVST